MWIKYKGELNILQYFGYVRHNLTFPDVFAKIMKVKNHIGLSDTDLAWYSLSATHQICLSSMEYWFRIDGFRTNWCCLIVEVLATQPKFLEWSGYCTVINCVFTFHATNVLGWFHDIMLPWHHALVQTCKP